jgi:hypothetical protein
MEGVLAKVLRFVELTFIYVRVGSNDTNVIESKYI